MKGSIIVTLEDATSYVVPTGDDKSIAGALEIVLYDDIASVFSYS